MSARRLHRATLAAGVLALGALVSFLGTRGSRADAMANERASMVTMPLTELCLPPEAVSGAVARGATLHERSCAGCHDRTERGVGPAYAAILASYRAAAGTGSVEGRLLSALARATTHPAPAWPAFAAPTSPPVLARDDEDAFAYWLLRGTPSASPSTSVNESSR